MSKNSNSEEIELSIAQFLGKSKQTRSAFQEFKEGAFKILQEEGATLTHVTVNNNVILFCFEIEGTSIKLKFTKN